MIARERVSVITSIRILPPSRFEAKLTMRSILQALSIAAAVCCCCLADGTNVSTAPAATHFKVPVTPVATSPLREAFYGDLHLHTSYSLDAYLIGAAKIDPDQAYRFAKGEAVTYLGQSVRRREPLDFLAVTDHAENIGVLNELEDPGSVFSSSEVGRAIRRQLEVVTTPDGHRDFSRSGTPPGEADPIDDLWRDYVGAKRNRLPEDLKAEPMAAWAREIDFANRNYQPGKFTTFIAYEWTAAPNAANLHRNVIFRGDSAPYPFTSFDSKDPQDLWDWLDAIRKRGFEALAIPHNGNASNGLMYDWIGAPEYMDRAYAQQRQANEPLSEIAQNKGASETHPLLSPNDEFANYEIYDFLEQYRHQVGRPQGSYLRDALSAGLVLQRRLGVNPFKYGFVGGSDLHSGLSVGAQADYAGSHWTANLGGGRPPKEQVAKGLAGPDAQGTESGGLLLKTTAGNLTGVWAESNTRESIYAALRRRETFATSGTRLRFRFFGGWNLPRNLLEQKNWIASAYAKGVPMGSDLPALPANAGSPVFAIWAVKDPNGGNLDRVQVIKVWEDGGRQKEQVYDVAWSGNRQRDPKTGQLPSVGNTVDVNTGKYANTIGAVELMVLWTDPGFNPHHAAAYYLRVLEIPTPRWSTLLAARYGLSPPKEFPAAEQQRGWSSPIWYTPSVK
jgi:hypothetical protein